MTAPASEVPTLRENLRSMLDQIETELNHAYLHNRLFVESREEFTRKYPEGDHTFLNHYARLYADRQIIAVRRMVDEDDRTNSLWWVIEKLRRNPKIGDRSDLLADHRRRRPYDSSLTKEWNDFYDTSFGTQSIPSATTLQNLLVDLVGPSSVIYKVKEYADQRVAHRDRMTGQVTLTYADLHAALTEVAEVFNTANKLLNWSTTCFCLMSIPPSWQSVFGAPLFQDGGPRRFTSQGCGVCGSMYIS